MALYHSPLCSYCLSVRRTIKRLNLQIELRNTARDARWREELLAGGGKTQVPCLMIRRADYTEWLYESDDIVCYLKVHFSR